MRINLYLTFLTSVTGGEWIAVRDFTLKGVVFISCTRAVYSRALAKRAATLGCNVYCCASDMDLAEDLIDAGVTPIQLDVASENSVADATKAILKSAGRIDHMFYTSHHTSFGGLEHHDATDAHYQFHVNLFGAVRLLRSFGPFLRSQRSGTYTICSSGPLAHCQANAGWHNACEAAIASIAETAKSEFSTFNVAMNHYIIGLEKLPKDGRVDGVAAMTGRQFVETAIDMIKHPPLGRNRALSMPKTSVFQARWQTAGAIMERLKS